MHRVEEIFLAAILVIVPIFALGVDSEASPTTAPTTAPSGTVELEAVIKPDSVIDRKMSLVLDRKMIGFRLYYVNGKLAEETFAYGRVLHGWQRRWYDNGQLKQIRPYLNGHVNGACQYWDVNGRQLPDDMVHNGCGVLHEYYSTGQVKSECPFVLGMKHGVERSWTEGGVLRSDCNFENGLQDGFDRVYQADGQLEMESYDRRGKSLGVLTFWKADGTIDRQEGTRYEIDGEAVPLTELQQGEAADADIARSLESMALAPAQKLPLTTRPRPCRPTPLSWKSRWNLKAPAARWR